MQHFELWTAAQGATAESAKLHLKYWRDVMQAMGLPKTHAFLRQACAMLEAEVAGHHASQKQQIELWKQPKAEK